MSLWQQRKQLLSDRSFILFLLSSFITVAGGAMCYIILTWYVVSMHSDRAIVAVLLLSLSFWLPSVIFGPFAGVIVDRYPRKIVIAISNLLRVLSFIIIGYWLLFDNALWICCLLNFINGMIFTVLGPAIMAFIREIVANKKLLAANSTLDICVELANVLGMGFAGILITFVKLSSALFLIAGCVAIGILLLLAIKQRSDQKFHRNMQLTTWHDFTEGMHYLIERPVLAMLYILNTILFIQFMISPILLAPFIKTVLHGNGHDFSLTELSLSIGIILGSFFIPWISVSYGRIRCLFWAIVWLIVMFLFIGMCHSIHNLIILYALLGLGLPLWSVIASFSQEFTDKSMQGRVQSLSGTISSLCILIIYSILGWSSSDISLLHVFWFCSALGVVALLVLYKISTANDILHKTI